MNGAHKQSIEEQEKAKFSFSGATLYGINAVIGSGIFLLPQKIYSGLGPASLAVMFGVAILVMLLSACLAETAGYFDKNGGAMQYSKAAFGDFVGFNVGILGWAVTVIAWAAMLAGFAKIFIITFPAFEGYNLPISIGMLILLSLMNIAGLKTSKMFTLTATVAKLIPIVLFSLFAIFFISVLSNLLSNAMKYAESWKVEQVSSVLFLVQPSTSSTVSSDLKPCLSLQGKCATLKRTFPALF